MITNLQATVPTRVLILSDTHGRNDISITSSFDLAIHCGDLTEGSRIAEFRSTLDLLRAVPSPTKVVIAGNHDITLEKETFLKHLHAAGVKCTDPAATKEYGQIDEARALLRDAEHEGIHFLEEGLHTLDLANGARVSLYVNPQTPRSKSEGALGDSEAGWAFQYDASSSQRRFDLAQRVDIFVTHGPPEGVLDYTGDRRAGCPSLFAAVARARPQLHCFGHVHAGWGAKLVTWRGTPSNIEKPCHFTAIDNDASVVLERLNFLKPGKFDSEEVKVEKCGKLDKMLALGYCQLERKVVKESKIEETTVEGTMVEEGSQTLFVNAAVQGDEEMPAQPPISTVLNLPRSS